MEHDRPTKCRVSQQSFGSIIGYPEVSLLLKYMYMNICSVPHNEKTGFLYPWHLCRRVYSFRLSVRPFVRLYVRSFVRTSVTFLEFASKFCVKVSQVVYKRVVPKCRIIAFYYKKWNPKSV